MGMARAALVTAEGLAWASIVGGILLTGSVGFSMGGGAIPTPSVSGLGTVPVGTLAVVTVVFAFFVALTWRVAP